MTRWTSDPGENRLRNALERIAPDLASLPMRLNPRVSQPDPLFWSGSAWLGDRFVVKYAWSELRDGRLTRESVLLDRLSEMEPRLRVPEVVAASDEPAVMVTVAAPGVPLTWELASALGPGELRHVAGQLGAFMARLHALGAAALLDGLREVVPHAQSTTDLLRERYPRLVDGRRARSVLGWCDWVDEVLDDSTAPPEVVVHGDLHGYNQVWDPDSLSLDLVVDFGECGLRDPHFDFRYLPGNADSLDVVRAVVEAYERESGRALRIERIMGWQVLTHLGDALWRTEAGVELPGGGDATSWVDDLERRLAQLDSL
jgi:aminoglycoside phosphotransferase (APT) family kinase protein